MRHAPRVTARLASPLPHAARRLLPALFAVFAGLLASPHLAASDTFAVQAVTPTAAAPGDALVIDGNGFEGDVASHAAFVYDAAAATGAMIRLEKVSPGTHGAARLEGVLGPAAGGPAAGGSSGQVVVWSGAHYQLPGALHAGDAATYLVRDAGWFVPSRSAAAPGLFSITHGSGGAGSAKAPGSLVIDLEDLDGMGQGIVLDILVDGGDVPPGDDPPARIITLSLSWLEESSPLAPANLGPDLAGVIRATFGPLGVDATADGSRLFVSWQGAPLGGGFAVASALEGP